MGCKNVLIKGGHAIGDAIDVLYDGEEYYYYKADGLIQKILMEQVVLFHQPLQLILHLA